MLLSATTITAAVGYTVYVSHICAVSDAVACSAIDVQYTKPRPTGLVAYKINDAKRVGLRAQKKKHVTQT